MTDKRSIFIDGVEQPYSRLTFAEKIAAMNYGLIPGEVSDDDIRTFIEHKTNLTKTQNWSQMAMSTAQGGARLDVAYRGASFDGRYVYFVARNSDTFVRFDTQGVFTAVGDWSQMNMSTAQGGAEVDVAYRDSCFDGRYVYFVPFNSDTFLRFDTQGVFTTVGDWDRMNMSTAQGGATLDEAYVDASFDGRYVYYAPVNSDTFLRFDTQGVFTTAGDWSQMNMSTAQGGALLDSAYVGTSFDGRYIYFVPLNSDTFVRFDTQGVFTTAGDWSHMNMSTAQGGAEVDDAYADASFDGRYVYFIPQNSDTFLRFDTQGVFTTVGDWDRMNMSTVQGGAELDLAYTGTSFDGRYVYYVPVDSVTFLRFDTQGVFTNTGDWDRMNTSTAQGGAELPAAYSGACFDGRYVYFVPRDSNSFVRFEAMFSEGQYQ